MVVFEQSGCISAKVVLLGQKWLYSGKSGGIRAKVVVVLQSGCILEKLLYSGKSSFIWQSVCILAKVVVILQSGCIGAKFVVFRQKWLYWGKSSCYRAKVVVFGQKML